MKKKKTPLGFLQGQQSLHGIKSQTDLNAQLMQSVYNCHMSHMNVIFINIALIYKWTDTTKHNLARKSGRFAEGQPSPADNSKQGSCQEKRNRNRSTQYRTDPSLPWGSKLPQNNKAAGKLAHIALKLKAATAVAACWTVSPLTEVTPCKSFLARSFPLYWLRPARESERLLYLLFIRSHLVDKTEPQSQTRSI